MLSQEFVEFKLNLFEEDRKSILKKEVKSDFEKTWLFILKIRINDMREMLELPTIEEQDKEETQRDFIDEMKSDMEEERDVYDDDTGETIPI